MSIANAVFLFGGEEICLLRKRDMDGGAVVIWKAAGFRDMLPKEA